MKREKIFLVIVIITFFITGCYSKEEKELAEKYKKQGELNAINYIKEKYNFNPKVKSVVEESNCNAVWGCLDSSPNGTVIVKFNDNNKDFYVYVTGEYESTEAIDDYQFNEIEDDIINFFRNNIDLNLYDYELQFNSRGINEYYNNDLDSVASYISQIELYYIGENNLNELNLDNIKLKFKNYTEQISLIEFKSIKNCNDYKQAKIENVGLSSDKMKDIYKRSMLTLHQGQKTFYKYNNISNYDDEIYVYSSQDDNNYEISIAKLSDLSNYKELYSDLNDKELVQVTKAYSIPSSKSFLYIYFPMDSVKAKKSDKIYFAAECNINGEKQYYIENFYGINSSLKMGSVGNYYIEQIRYSQCDVNSAINFALIKINQ